MNPALTGACLGLILSIPMAALLASLFGDTYEVRSTIYLLVLLWCVIGAVNVYLITADTEVKMPNLKRVLLWCLSLWFWPVLSFMYFKHKRSK